MSVRCPSCGFDSADGALFCDFCKEPFNKKPKAAAAPAPAAPAPKNPLEGLSKEQLLELPADQLLKAEEPPAPAAPSWLRSAAWAFFAAWLVGGSMILLLSYQRYQQRAAEAPPPGP